MPLTGSSSFVFIFALACLYHLSVSATIDHKSRGPEKTHFTEDEHGEKHHNAEFDHESFLGKDEAKTFDQLTPEESKERLLLIIQKIDKDQDGLVSEEELIEWIQHVQDRYIWTDVERQWADFQGSKPVLDYLSWKEYKGRMFGDHIDEDNLPPAESVGYNYKDMIRKDKRRWEMADVDKDGNLSKKEFMGFLHPEEVPHMSHITSLETLEEIDKNGDGKVTLEEYLADLWPNPDNSEEEPSWVKNERDQFQKHRDKNHDGFMDIHEIREWILPSDYDQSTSEAKHLIYESDADRDGMLTKEEILDKYDIFVGSQATDFGEALTRHDEF